MRKVLIVNTVPYLVGGISKVIINYYKELDLGKYKVDFVINSFVEDEYLEIMKQGGAQTFVLDRSGSTKKYFLSLIKIVKENKYDAVHIHGNSCTMAIDLLAAKLGGCKKLIAHSHNTRCDHMKAHRILRPIFEICVTHRVACGEAAGRWLFHKKPFEVLPNAFRVDNFKFNTEARAKYRKSWNVDENHLVLGHIGLFNEQKNQQYLIDLIKVLASRKKNATLVLVGEGDLMPQVTLYARQLGVADKVIFYGVSGDIPGLLSAMDVFVFPSKWEGLSVVLLEAQMSGLPCIVSDAVSQEGVLSENVKFLSLDDSEEWIEHICSVSVSDGQRKCFLDSNKDNINRYNIKNCISQLESLYD